MAVERAIGVTALVLGVVVVVLAFDGCGGGSDPEEKHSAVGGCPTAHSSQPVLAAKLTDERRVVRFAYDGPSPPGGVCGFATSRHGRLLYVELRRPGDAPADRTLRCVEGRLNKPAPPVLRVEPISALRDGAVPELVDLLLAPSRRCPAVPRMQPSFIID